MKKVLKIALFFFVSTFLYAPAHSYDIDPIDIYTTENSLVRSSRTVPPYVYVMLTTFEPKTGGGYEDRVLAIIVEPYSVKYGKTLVCRGVSGASRYMVKVYRKSSGSPHEFNLTVGQYGRGTGFSTILSMTLPNGSLDFSSFIMLSVPVNTYISSSRDAVSLQADFNVRAKRYREKFQKMDCKIVNNTDELNKFLTE